MLNIYGKPSKAISKRKRDNHRKKKIIQLLDYCELESSTEEVEESPANHGLPYVANRNIHWFERFFWKATFVLSGVLIFVLTSKQYTRYLAAPIVMSVEMDYFNWNMSFPAITLCPHKKIDGELKAAFVNETSLQLGPDLGASLGSYLEAISMASLITIRQLQIPAAHILPLINSSDYAILAAQIFRRFDTTSLTTSTVLPMSIQPVMTEMGMCHTINSNVAMDNPANWRNDSVLYTKRNIELSFYDSDFFVQILNYADSYKIYTQSPDDIILSDSRALPFDFEGFLWFGVQMSSTRASPELRPMALYQRKCRFVNEPNNTRYPVYSYNRCLMECRIRMIKILCGCVPHFYRPLADEKVCNLAELKCLVKYMKEITTLAVKDDIIIRFGHIDGLPRISSDCGCLGECEPNFYLRDFETFLPQEGLKQLKIILAPFPKVRILREIIFSFWDFVLRSGGLINLCIGTSVISVMELIIRFLKCILRLKQKTRVLSKIYIMRSYK